jgi:hypothetical protein
MTAHLVLTTPLVPAAPFIGPLDWTLQFLRRNG